MSSMVDGYIDSICSEIIESEAINHPYLHALEAGNLPNVELALQDFAFQYSAYSAQFTEYVSAVITNLSNPEHKKLLQANLDEEQGHASDEELPPDVLACVEGLPHTSLYKRFQHAIGVDSEYLNTTQYCPASLRWRHQFLGLCNMNEFVGIGAIGIGTELIVSHIYKKILAGLQSHSKLTMNERVFFHLHSQCDEGHAAQILKIAKDLAQDEEQREQIAYGARAAVDMRVAFWDEMLTRAQSFRSSRDQQSNKFEHHAH